MGVNASRESGSTVPGRRALPRVSWVSLATLLLTVGVLVTFVLELRYIVRSRPAEELSASILWVTGGRGREPGKLDAPMGLAVDPSGDIYLADQGNARVQRFSAGGDLLSLWPAGDGEPLTLVRPSDVVVGGAGEVYVLDTAVAIYRLEPGGGLREVVPLAPLRVRSPRGLAVDHDRGRFYVADTGGGRVLLVGMDGTLIDTWGGRPEGELSFENPWGLGLDSQGNLFVAEIASSRIRKLSPGGEVLAEWRAKGALFDLAVGPDDRVYVTGSDRPRLWVYDNDGKALGRVVRLLDENRVGRTRGVTVIRSGEVVMSTEASIVRLSLQFRE